MRRTRRGTEDEAMTPSKAAVIALVDASGIEDGTGTLYAVCEQAIEDGVGTAENVRRIWAEATADAAAEAQ